ncbi:MAG: hypothetical protein H6718_25065 [Polyangiaceae bacterium]|nr:hypothetical protein [Polyangiaceae bacterium]MCB9605263.1 hypothetical protein [Polyangiaceae bacterium]
MLRFQLVPSDLEEEVELPPLPPLEADEEPPKDIDYSDWLTSVEEEDGDEAAGPELDLGIEIAALGAEDLEDDDPEPELEYAALLNLPDADADDDEPGVELGDWMGISAGEIDQDWNDDSEGPLEAPTLETEQLPDLGVDAEEEGDFSDFSLEEPEDVQEPWHQTPVFDQPSCCISDGPRLLCGGSGVWAVAPQEQLAESDVRDLVQLPHGNVWLDLAGRVWLDGQLQELSSRVVQVEASGEEAGALLAVGLDGTLYQLKDAGAAASGVWRALVTAPLLTRLAHGSFPTLGVSKSDRLCRSLDGGNTWLPIDTEQPPLAWLRSHDLKVHSRGSLIALGNERAGLTLSTDGGLTFSEVGQLLGLSALTSGRLSDANGPGLRLFAACYDAAIDESRIYAIDPLEFSVQSIAVIGPQAAEQDPRVRALHFKPGVGLLCAGDFGLIELVPPDGLDPVV